MEWLELIRVQSHYAQQGDWLGFFLHEDAMLPTTVWKNKQENNRILLPHAQPISLDGELEVAVINSSSRQFFASIEALDPSPTYEFIKRMRILQFTKGRNRTPYLFLQVQFSH